MNEQIEEMAKICTNKCRDCHNHECKNSTKSQHCIAETLYNADYRKQEWISVEERLPPFSYYDYVLAWDGHHVEFLHYSHRYQRWEDYFSMQKHPWEVTHWMPLPEPPKGE